MGVQNEWIVVGGGIGGAYMASKLANAGCKVTLIEGAAHLGGILAGPSWHGFELDNGCHLFDFAHQHSAAFFREVTQGALIPVYVQYASIGDHGREDGIAVPDFSNAPAQTRAAYFASLEGAANSGASQSAPSNCSEAIAARFGPLLAEALIPGIDKLCGQASASLAPEAFDILSYAKRIRLGDDGTMAQLKSKGAHHDERLAIKAKASVEPRNYYPKSGGMRAFCTQLKSYLEAKGVHILMDTKVTSLHQSGGKAMINNDRNITADKVYWSLPSATLAPVLGVQSDLRAHFHPVRVNLLAFSVDAADINDVTYMHDYCGANPVFRSSCGGIYGQQVDAQGRAFVTAECYDSLIAPTWDEAEVTPDAIFEQLKNMGQIGENAHYSAHTSWSLPTGLVLPKMGWLDAVEPLQAQQRATADWLVSNPIVPRGKRLIFDEADELLAKHL